MWGCSAGSLGKLQGAWESCWELGKAAFPHGFSACGTEQVTETSTPNRAPCPQVMGPRLCCSHALFPLGLTSSGGHNKLALSVLGHPEGEELHGEAEKGREGVREQPLLLHMVGRPSQTNQTTEGGRSSTAVSLKCPYCSQGRNIQLLQALRCPQGARTHSLLCPLCPWHISLHNI